MGTNTERSLLPGSFEAQFQARLDDIERRGKEQGLTLTHICRDSGVARATPDRWRVDTPKTITLVDELEAVVVAAEQKAAKAQ